jgi:hypothetical protein
MSDAGSGEYADLTEFEEGEHIVELQQRLTVAGHEVPESGVFDEETRLSLAAFALERGLAELETGVAVSQLATETGPFESVSWRVEVVAATVIAEPQADDRPPTGEESPGQTHRADPDLGTQPATESGGASVAQAAAALDAAERELQREEASVSGGREGAPRPVGSPAPHVAASSAPHLAASPAPASAQAGAPARPDGPIAEPTEGGRPASQVQGGGETTASAADTPADVADADAIKAELLASEGALADVAEEVGMDADELKSILDTLPDDFESAVEDALSGATET